MNKKNLFVSNLGWKHSDFDKMIKLIKKKNIRGIDIAPIQLNNSWKNIEKKLQKFQKKLKYLNIKVNAIQGVFYKTNFNLFKSNSIQKKKIYAHLKKILEISKIFKCNKIIIGSSSFRKLENLSKEQADFIFINFFKDLKSLLNKKKIYLCFEAIPKNYGENYLYNLKKLVFLIKKIKSPWFKINFDTSLFHFAKFDKKIFIKNRKYIKNIQISEKNFNYLIKPNKSNLYFSKLINKDNKNKDISLEIIAKNTNLKKMSLSLSNFRNIFN
tara:strand:+ start:705 stop:1514 length:810 start_codon:yes stop_codon:yes gene_type:complete